MTGRPPRLAPLAVALLVGATLLGLGATAHASGITLGRYGGMFGHPNADRGLALYWNPARLGLHPGRFVTIDSTLVRRDASYDRVIFPDNPYYDQPGVLETNVGLATTSTMAVLPYGAGGAAWELDEVNIGFALGAYPMYGGSAGWDKNPQAPDAYPGGLDGPQRWSGINSTFLILHYTGAFGITLTEWGLSFGFGISYADGTIATTRARNVNRSESLLDERGFIQEGRVYFEGDDHALSMHYGVSYDSDTVTASAVYRSGYNLDIRGDLYQAYGSQPPVQVRAFLDFPTPHVFQTAFTLRFGNVEMTGMTDYSAWSRMEANNIFVEKDPPDLLLEIPRNLRDTFSLRGMMGGNVGRHHRWHIAGMLGYDMSAVPEETIDAALSDAAKIQVGIGARGTIGEHLGLLTSYQYDIWSPVEADNSIHEPTANGIYRDSRHWVNLSLEGRF